MVKGLLVYVGVIVLVVIGCVGGGCTASLLHTIMTANGVTERSNAPLYLSVLAVTFVIGFGTTVHLVLKIVNKLKD